jgi:hypothetical protein
MAVPSGKDFSNLKTCDNMNSDASSEPVLSDSIAQILGGLSYLDNFSGPGNTKNITPRVHAYW